MLSVTPTDIQALGVGMFSSESWKRKANSVGFKMTQNLTQLIWKPTKLNPKCDSNIVLRNFVVSTEQGCELLCDYVCSCMCLCEHRRIKDQQDCAERPIRLFLDPTSTCGISQRTTCVFLRVMQPCLHPCDLLHILHSLIVLFINPGAHIINY